MVPPLHAKLSVPDSSVKGPRLGRLAIIIAVGFLLGLTWPLLVGMNFVQRPPGTPPAKPEELESPPIESEPEPSPGPAPKSKSTEVTRAAAHVKPAVTSQQTVRLEGSVVASCNDGAERVSKCDEPNLMGVIDEPIGKLAHCAAADGASGVLSLGLALDFGRGHVNHVKAGQSTTLSKDKSAALLACAKDHVVGTPLGGVQHQHETYWVYYLVRFLPPGSPLEIGASPHAEEVVSASGQGTIGWKTAVVREGPSAQAKISTRLLYGTRVNVTGRAGEWYRIEHGGRVGWVHGKAIGM